jgi:hypothetical protein
VMIKIFSHHEAHEGHEVSEICSFTPFVIFVNFVVKSSGGLASGNRRYFYVTR